MLNKDFDGEDKSADQQNSSKSLYHVNLNSNDRTWILRWIRKSRQSIKGERN